MTWKKDLRQFQKEMRQKLQANVKEKGPPEKSECSNFDRQYLWAKMMEHAEADNWPDVANYAFLLWNGEASLKPKSTVPSNEVNKT